MVGSGVRVACLQHLRELGHLHLAAFAHAWLFVITIVACVLDHVFTVEPLLQAAQRPVQWFAFSDAYFSQKRFTSFPITESRNVPASNSGAETIVSFGACQLGILGQYVTTVGRFEKIVENW